ncbi:hypothetical protein K431DRAFT_341496 [Polychaeton citri CBS 116435]|uniref:U3 small nucleolar RNA-associated protein 6 N-terminal domain-containing protein n=1 Tax=Polychaeton citri CBS 116435 TaxID=1314669 RepID=A0A9P4Q365_9PEZI|nr:hypothetical protein K431DRAFT_341496 [Polychaeton citri CBS 116435]
MAAATDKARFYLEKYVPELQEYERKKIFSRDEIQAIASKRSDFEHLLSARGSTPSDYVRYATYEMNLDSLRKKRCKRLAIKNATTFNGQRTVFFIMDRATKKFPGDIGLWMQYVSYCQREKASKKLAKVFTAVLRLRPTDWGLWVLAAKHYHETQGDMEAARSYLQRGLRFCSNELKMYLEYVKLEMIYLAKLAARRKILGLDQQAIEQQPSGAGSFDSGDDVVALATTTFEDFIGEVDPEMDDNRKDSLQKLAGAPAFSGAIPMAIFDAATKHFQGRTDVALDFYDLVASFRTVTCTPRILKHIVDRSLEEAPTAPTTIICEAKNQLFGAAPDSTELPVMLGRSLAVLKNGLSITSNPTLADQLDEGIRRVIEASLKRHIRVVLEAQPGRGVKQGHDRIRDLLSAVSPADRDADVQLVARLAGLVNQ